MEQGMQQQRGAALVIVLALLTGALVVGVSGMQSSLIDERLAGNYRASAQAQMNAEQAATLAIQNISDYDEDDAEDNRISLNVSTPEDVKQLRYDKIDDDLAGKTDGDCDSGGADEDRCFYFPLAIGDDDYWAAFGAVKSDAGRGDVVSQHVVLVKLMSEGDFPDADLEGQFNNYGILAKDQVDIEKDFTFWGKARSGDQLKSQGIVCGEGGGTSCLEEGSVSIKQPLDFSAFMKDMKNRFPLVLNDGVKNSGCEIEAIGKYLEEDQYCTEQIEIKDNIVIKNAELYFKNQAEFKGNVTLESSTLYFKDEVDFQGSVTMRDATLIAQDQMDINGTVSGSEITLVSHDQMGILGSVDASDSVLYAGKELDIFGSVDMTNSSIVSKEQLDTEGGLTLSNTVIVVDDEANMTSKYGPRLNNVLIMVKDQLDIELARNAQVNRGWFYSGDQMDVDIKSSPNMSFCGSLVARDEIDFITDGSRIMEFRSAGQGGCPEFEPFEDPRGSSAGGWRFDAWQ